MKITKELAIWLLKIQHLNPEVQYPFYIMNQEYGDDDDFVWIEPEEWELMEDEEYQTFELREKESISI